MLLPRVRFALLTALLVLAVWWPLRSGSVTSPRATEVGAEAALVAVLEVREGLRTTKGDIRYLSDPTGRPWSEGLGYVPALLTAKPSDAPDGETEDLYYLEVRTTADGTPLAIRRLSNLTRTPHASERLLAIKDQVALIQVEVFGQLQSMLMVDVAGDERDTSALQTRVDKWRYEITNLQKTGRERGVGMRLYSLAPPPERVEVGQEGDDFVLSLVDSGDKAPSVVRISASEGTLRAANKADEGRLTYQPRYFAAKTLTPWLVDTIRDLSWVGPRKIALLEQFVFRWRDNIKQGAFALGLISGEGNLAEELGQDTELEAGAMVVGPVTRVGDWPPPDVKPGIKEPAKGEGEWTPVQPKWLRTLPGAPPAFMKTAVRMDPDRPYDNVVLIAMDMRQMDLGMVPGTVTPESSFGMRGDGLMPRDPKVVDRLVAAFNGGFKTAHGAYGMVVDRKTIMPAMPYAATIALNDQGQVLMGSWYNSMTPPKDMHSLRQNLPPLISGGVLNPTGKRKWGGTASDLDGVHTTRSGVSIRGSHTLIFAWCKSCSADALGMAMIAAGCQYGMHLDMNPTHTGFSWYRTESRDLDAKGSFERFEVTKGSKAMGFREARYIKRDVKDFFYLTLRPTFVDALPAPPEGWAAWSAEGTPRGQDSIFPLAATSKGPEAGDLIAVVDMGRLKAKMRRGDAEPDPTSTLGQDARRAPPVALEDPALLIDLGITDLEAPVGFFSEKRIVAPVIAGQPALVRDADGTLRVVSPKEAKGLTPRDVAHLRGGVPLLLDGAIVPLEAPISGRHHALGWGQKRLFYVSTLDAAATAAHMKHLGAETAMLLPKTPHEGARIAWLKVEEGRKLQEIEAGGGQTRDAAQGRDASTHLYFERRPDPARIAALVLEEVVLSKEEAKRQRRLQLQIKTLREELRQIENAKYRAFQEKVKALREQKQ